MSAHQGICPKCGHLRIMTRHHVYPRRWEWEGELRDATTELCRECHSDLELIIDEHEGIPWCRRQLPQSMYARMVHDFLRKGG